jgi:hypothetical protein
VEQKAQQEQFEKDKKAAETANTAALAKFKTDHTAASIKLTAENTAALAKLKADHSTALSKATTEHTAELAKLKADHAAAMTKLKGEQSTALAGAAALDTDIAAKRKRLESELSAELDKQRAAVRCMQTRVFLFSRKSYFFVWQDVAQMNKELAAKRQALEAELTSDMVALRRKQVDLFVQSTTLCLWLSTNQQQPKDGRGGGGGGEGKGRRESAGGHGSQCRTERTEDGTCFNNDRTSNFAPR